MNPDNFRLLIHHHHLAYHDKDGVIWLSSVIGRWVDALADHLSEVGLLLYESEQRLPQQDTPISKSNIKLYSLGPRRTLMKRIFRRSRVHLVCAEAGRNSDGLLIRGPTSHQFKIWRFTSVNHKAFLLVGSLTYRKLTLCSLKGILRFLISYFGIIKFHKMTNDSTLLLANSPALVSEIDQIFGYEAYFVPTNSIWKSEFAPPQVRTVSNPRKLLYCGRLDLEKGIRELIQALAILNQKEGLYQLDIVGEKCEPVFTELKELANDLGVAYQIRWHGLVPYGPGLFSFYQRADVLVLPSYTEGFPHVIWEAMANSCPVITTSVGGIPALIEHGEHALLIPPKNINAIVNAVKRLLAEDTLREKLVEQAYQYAMGFSVEACAQKLVHLLHEEWH